MNCSLYITGIILLILVLISIIKCIYDKCNNRNGGNNNNNDPNPNPNPNPDLNENLRYLQIVMSAYYSETNGGDNYE